MSLTETIKAKTDELRELYPLVEAGDANAIKGANSIADELDELKNRKDAADRFKGILDGIGTNDVKGYGAKRTLADEIADGLKGAMPGERFSRTIDLKAATTDVLTKPTITDVDTRMPQLPEDLGVLDLFSSETISGNAITYFIGLGFTGSPATVAENSAKAQIGPNYEQKTDSLTKIAAYWKETDEVLEDAPYLASAIQNRGIYLLRKTEEAQVLAGNGTAPNLQGVLNRSGIQTLTYTAASGNSNGTMAQQILKAMMDVESVSGFAADAIVIHPTDYFGLRTATDGNGQFFGGGYFTGAYGNGGLSAMPYLWGLRTVISSAITQGTILVGAFRPGASIVRKGGIRVEVANQHDVDFTSNRLTVLVEERLALAVRYPGAFVKLTASA